MPTFSRQSSRHSRDAAARSISQITSIARSAPSMTRSCAHATLTRSESRMLAMRDGTRFASRRQRASLTIFQRSHVSLSPSQITRTVGMAQCYFSIWSVMDARIAGSWLARQSSGEPLLSFCGIWLRRERQSQTSIAAPVIYCRHLRFGQMRYQSPNTALEPTPITPCCFRCGFRVGGSHRRRWLSFFR